VDRFPPLTRQIMAPDRFIAVLTVEPQGLKNGVAQGRIEGNCSPGYPKTQRLTS